MDTYSCGCIHGIREYLFTTGEAGGFPHETGQTRLRVIPTLTLAAVLPMACLWLGPTRRFCSFGEPRTAPSNTHTHTHVYTHMFIYKGDTSTHAQGTDPRVALGASHVYTHMFKIYLCIAICLECVTRAYLKILLVERAADDPQRTIQLVQQRRDLTGRQCTTINRSHTHTYIHRDPPPRHRHTHTHTHDKNNTPNPQTNTSR